MYEEKYRVVVRHPLERRRKGETRQYRPAEMHAAQPGGLFIPRGHFDPRQFPRWGTLGGFVTTAGGDSYAVVANHVAHQAEGFGTPVFVRHVPEFLRGITRQLPLGLVGFDWELGDVKHRSQPTQVPEFSCTATAIPSSEGLDAALVQCPQSRAARRKVPFARLGQLWQRLPLRFVGARSGSQEVRITNRSIWHSYELRRDNPEWACVPDCLQIGLRQRSYVKEDVSAGGDLGAWIMAQSADGPVWVGMLLGGDGDRSGIHPAERIVSYFSSILGPLTPTM